MIAKVVYNQLQTTCINLKQNIDILKAKVVAKHQPLSQFVLEIHSLVLPQVRMLLITKIISI
jgi:hypothetical protein